MLKESDNFIAEQILLLAAQKTSDTLKSEIAIDYMKEFYLKDLPDEPMWYDGSGLSRYNLFTPRSMVKLLEKIKKEVPQEKLLDMLPTGGHSGTIKNYYKAKKTYIFAKTGTLKNNHSISGFLKTKSGKLLIFSFMNSNYTVPTSVLKAEMEKVLLSIRDNY
jgi:D-alanyl-D-alanine carboxypeptidase/D-alanyl-D-alanine-endopeptidase (penicillin-binding protein 4)